MSGPAAMSNTEDASADAVAARTFLDVLAGWGDALQAYGRALASYAAEVNDVAQRMLDVHGAAAWGLALRAAQETGAVQKGAAREGQYPPESADNKSRASERADMLEVSEIRLFGAEDVLLNPAVRDSAASGVGRTFSDNLARLLEAVRHARHGCSIAHSTVLAAAKAYGRGLAQTRPEEVLMMARRWWAATAPFDSNDDQRAADSLPPEHGGVASAVYTWALARMRADGGSNAAAAEKLLEAAKNGSLGAPGETPEAILADSHRGRGYHPIQTMGAMPRLVPNAAGKTGKSESADNRTGSEGLPGVALPGLQKTPDIIELAAVVDARLPQAKKDVLYDLAALTDPSRAAGGTVRSGLSYKLVERLRSIQEIPRDGEEQKIQKSDSQQINGFRTTNALPDRVSGSFLLSIGGPQVLRATPPGRPWLEGDWAPAAGVPPRLAVYSDAVGVLVAARQADVANLVDKFTAESSSEKDASGLRTRVSLDVLLARVMQKFSGAFDAAFGDGPATPAEFLRVAAPSEYVSGLYLEAAVFDVGLAHLNRLLDRFWAPGASGSKISAEGARRELAATAAVQAAAAGFELWRRVVGAYQRRAPDGALFAFAPDQRKAALSRVHREVVASVLAAPPLEYVQFTFKLFRLLGGSVSSFA